MPRMLPLAVVLLVLPSSAGAVTYGLGDAAGTPRIPWCAFYGSGTCNGDPSAPVFSSPAATG